jgi:hypothetical protein
VLLIFNRPFKISPNLQNWRYIVEKTKEIYDEVYNELMDEFDMINIKEKPRGLDELEKMIDKFGREFERRVLERTAKNQSNKIDKKKLRKL